MAHAYKIELSNEDKDYLRSLTRQRTIQAQIVDRAKTLLYKAEGVSNGGIADRLDVNINTVTNWRLGLQLSVKKPNYFTVPAALRELEKIELCRHLDRWQLTKLRRHPLVHQRRAVRRRRLKTEQRAGLIGLVAPSERHVRLVVKSLEVHNLH